MPHLPILVPAYQPDQRLVWLTKQLCELGCTRIVVVDDGSSQEFIHPFYQLPDGVTVLHHKRNLGKGAALKTGISFIQNEWPDVMGLVTADADGQHLPEDIVKVSEQLKRTPNSLVMGSRSFSGTNVPLRSQVGNRLVSLCILLASRRWFPDSQTGLRGLPSHTWDDLLKITSCGYEFETEVLMVCRQLTHVTVPIATVYIEDNRSSHFHPLKDSLSILRALLRRAWWARGER